MNNKGYKVLDHLDKNLVSYTEYIKKVKEIDDMGFLDENLGEELQSIVDSEEYILGVHRTGYTRDPNIIEDVFKKGLYNNGHAMSGANVGKCDIEKTVTIIDDLFFLSYTLKTVDSYKKSNGCFIVKIPKSYLGLKEGKIMPIYYQEYGLIKLCPEFIYGYIPVSNHKAERIIRNPNYKNQHNILNENSAYDDSVTIRYGNLPTVRRISLKEKYDIIHKAYVDTLNKYGDKQALTALFKIINESNFMYFTGARNRELLSRHVLFSDITKILCFGLNLDSNQIDDVINLFHLSILDEINKKYNKST